MARTKKRKLNKNDYINATENEKQIISQIDNYKLKLSTMIKIYQLYQNSNQYEYVRLRCVEYFENYHKNKYDDFYDVDSYIRFIIMIITDPSQIIFKPIDYLYEISLNEYTYNQVINNKRFIQWFKDQYKENKDHIRIKYHKIYDISLSNRINMLKEYTIDDEFNKLINRIQDDNNNNNNIKNQINNNNETTSTTLTYQLPDLIIKHIINFTLELDGDENSIDGFDQLYSLDNQVINNLKLVSKQFNKVITNQLYDEYYYYHWYNQVQNKLYIIKQLPTSLDNESLRYIPYHMNKDKFKLLFSKVESYTVICDGRYHSHNCYINDHYINEIDDYIPSCSKFLVIPPPMPSLKNLSITGNYGFQIYSDHIIDFIIDCKESGGNIESFSFNLICEDDYCISLLEPLFEHHINSLKSINISIKASINSHRAKSYMLDIMLVLINQYPQTQESIIVNINCLNKHGDIIEFNNIKEWIESEHRFEDEDETISQEDTQQLLELLQTFTYNQNNIKNKQK